MLPTAIWRIEQIWKGETVFLFGGGPSLKAVDLERLRDRKTLALNSTAKLALWASALFFTDHPWLEKNHALVTNWSGYAFTLSYPQVRNLPTNVKSVCALVQDELFTGGAIKRGRTTGHTAISLAAILGAKRIVLLGYDMRFVGGRSHCHDDYASPNEKIYSDDFIPYFKGWNEAARKAGVEVLNATPGSALEEFPMVDLAAVID